MIKRFTVIFFIICLLITTARCFASRNDGIWFDILQNNFSVDKFVMSGMEYAGASRPNICGVDGQSFNKSAKFFGKNTVSYRQSKYTGRIYHDYLKNGGRIPKDTYITFVFYAKAEMLYGGEPRITAVLQAETDGHIMGNAQNTYYSDTISLSENWKKYSLTLKVENDLSPEDAGYRIMLELGYYGQNTYIADFKAYSSKNADFDENMTADNISVLQNGEEIEKFEQGEISFSADCGSEADEVFFIAVLFDLDGGLYQIDISCGKNPRCSVNVPKNNSDYTLKTYIINKQTLKPQIAPTVYCPSENVKNFELEFADVYSKPGEPCIFHSDDLPDVVLCSNRSMGEYTVWLTGVNTNFKILDKVILDCGDEKIIRLPDYMKGVSDGEYKITVNAYQNEKNLGSECLYFYISGKAKQSAFVSEGELVIVPDFKGNRIPDYSSAGYRNGEEIPNVQNVIEISPSGGDDTKYIQDAIDEVSAKNADNNGIRGAILLKEGVWQVSDTLKIQSSGVVIRGENYRVPKLKSAEPTDDIAKFEKDFYNGGTVIFCTSDKVDSLLFSVGGAQGINIDGAPSASVISQYVPVGEYEIEVDNPQNFYVGESVVIVQTANKDWIDKIGMNSIPARETADVNPNNPDNITVQWSDRTIKWQFERVVKSIDRNKITLDIPIMNVIDKKFSNAKIYKYTDERISDFGIENITAFSAWEPKNGIDTNRHMLRFADIENAKDIWIKNVTASHFNTYCINISKNAKRVSIDTFYNMVADKSYYSGGGYDESGRYCKETGVYVGRYGIYISGEQNFMTNVCGINNRHLIEYGSFAAGTNAAVYCRSQNPLASMGPHMLWSVGGLYDNVTGYIQIQNRLNMGTGHGWSGAHYTVWNSKGTLTVQRPPTAQNYSVGHVGDISNGAFEGYENGDFSSYGKEFEMKSLYYYQKNKKC